MAPPAPDSDFYLFANVNFKPGRYDAWQKAYDGLGEYVFANEPTTKSYYFGVPPEYKDDISETTMMFAFEVYDKRESLYVTHFNSAAMGEFQRGAVPEMATGFDLQHYASLGGFLDAPGDRRECGVMHDAHVTCKSAADRRAVADSLRRLAASLGADGLVGAGVWTWMAYECLDNETDLRIYGRFRDWDAMKTWDRRAEVLGLWEKHGWKEVDKVVQRALIPTGKGWLHR
ncbi:uncharacterized protein E0L32_011159 [Thyridium curvatum]|uniref:Uncharacterized protein n=1 Tax=Thyridium curvatum TaxID=1093900 RepID=A0A507AD88_9PEZI|nr:uncharacterized protein E0L32_011159 [Thyridium curvatum]TPX06935.1 hypothetical protein E0L32_011159 [Thyridium curvatum]